MKKINILPIIIIFLILLIIILLFNLNGNIVEQEAINDEGIITGIGTETYEIEKKSEKNPQSPRSEGDRYSKNIWEYYDRVEEAKERTIRGS